MPLNKGLNMLKSILISLLALLTTHTYAAKIINGYYIVENQKDALKIYQQTITPMIPFFFIKGHISSFPELKHVADEIYQAYLSYFNMTSKEFPKPYIDIAGNFTNAANISYRMNNRIYPTNLIVMGESMFINKDKVTYLDSFQSILAHEMAHYFHKHAIKNKFISANQTAERVLNQENNFGEAIAHDKNLTRALNDLSKVYKMLEPKSKDPYEDLKIIRFGANTISQQVLKKMLSLSFDNTASTVDQKICRQEVKIITKNIIQAQEVNLEDIDKLSKVFMRCQQYSVALTTKQMLNKIFGKQYIDGIYHLAAQEDKQLKDIPLTHRLCVESIRLGDHPLITLIKAFYTQRAFAQALVKHINFDKVLFYSTEDEADMTAFSILDEIGLPQAQLYTFDVQWDNSECKEELKNFREDKITSLHHLYMTKKHNIHSPACWRYYRTEQMLRIDE
jgi:hypothetical protein